MFSFNLKVNMSFCALKCWTNLNNAYYLYSGEQNRPANSTLLEALCLMKKRKGWSAMKVSGIISDLSETTAAVAAAASVPSSFTSTKALCTTFDSTRSFPEDMPENREVL